MIISFNIDIAGSTAAKQEILKVIDDPKIREENYASFANIIINLEKKIYRLLTAEEKIRKNLFLVKSIGDELWFLIKLDTTDYLIIKKIISSLMEIVKDHHHMNIFSRKLTHEEKITGEIPDSVKKSEYIIGYKCFIDIIEEAIELNKPRIDKIIPHIYEINNFKNNSQLQSPGFTNLRLFFKALGNLNLGRLIRMGKKIKITSIRSDLIGPDIDLFFRCASKTYPGMVCMGEKLAKFFDTKFTDDNHVNLHYDSNLLDSYYGILQTYSKEELKGILNPYQLTYLIDQYKVPFKHPNLKIFDNAKEFIQKSIANF